MDEMITFGLVCYVQNIAIKKAEVTNHDAQ